MIKGFSEEFPLGLWYLLFYCTTCELRAFQDKHVHSLREIIKWDKCSTLPTHADRLSSHLFGELRPIVQKLMINVPLYLHCQLLLG